MAGRVKKEQGLEWFEYGERLNEFCLHVEHVFSPQLIIIQRGVSRKHKKFLSANQLDPHENCAGRASQPGGELWARPFGRLKRIDVPPDPLIQILFEAVLYWVLAGGLAYTIALFSTASIRFRSIIPFSTCGSCWQYLPFHLGKFLCPADWRDSRLKESHEIRHSASASSPSAKPHWLLCFSSLLPPVAPKRHIRSTRSISFHAALS